MEGSIKELAKYRFEQALEDLDDAKICLNNGRYKLALNRAYYAIFHAMRAVNALDSFDSRKHSGVKAHFNQHHVKTGDFPKSSSKIVTGAYSLREHADYEDFYVASKEDAYEQTDNATIFIELVREYLITKEVITK